MVQCTIGEISLVSTSEKFERLTLASIDRLEKQSRPLVDPSTLKPRILHFGLGAFHRAHQAVYIEIAAAKSNEPWGIVAVAPSSMKSVDDMRAQDCLYSVTERDGAGARTRVTGSIINVLHLKEDQEEIENLFLDPQLSNVMLTVTEKGYFKSTENGGLNTGSEMISLDLENTESGGQAYRTVISVIAFGLVARFHSSRAPINIISCDNMAKNGEVLKKVIRNFIELSSWPNKDDVLSWITDSVAFPSTVVDQIVPPTSQADYETASIALGLRDEMAVCAEPYRQWVIEDSFKAPRPQWELAGALIVPEVVPYQLLKLRLLNGSHSALAYLGLACGFKTISEVLESDWAERLIRAFAAEVAPSLLYPSLDIPDYVESLLERFRNPAMHHQLRVIGSDGSLKIPERWFGALATLDSLGAKTPIYELILAGWVSATQPEKFAAYGITDPAAEMLAKCWDQTLSKEEIVEKLLRSIGANEHLVSQGLVSRISSHLEAISQGRVEL